MNRAALFEGQPDWLAHTLTHASLRCPEITLPLPNGTLSRLDTGVLRVEPHTSPSDSPALILSAGIHGNETAPIELLNTLVNRMADEQLTVAVPLLLILGNPPAMVAETRFTDYNLNRLFCGAWQDYPICAETRRASQLETVCRAFRAQHGGALRHYDLHTAIRPSRREKFALYPFVEGRQVPGTEQAFLTEAGIGTLLLQHKAGTTFSSFSSQELGAESFTLELGKVHPFGENDLSRLCQLEEALTRLISHQPAPSPGQGRLPETFEVVHEILNTGDHFRFHVADDVANFTEYSPGTLIWEDDATEYRVGDRPEAIIFPNRHVPVGQRVGLLIRRQT